MAKVGEFVVAILRDRWVLVGWRRREGDRLIYERARIVRIWGTAGDTSGLATLAKWGPTSETILEDEGTARCHLLAETFCWDGDANAPEWKRVYR